MYEEVFYIRIENDTIWIDKYIKMLVKTKDSKYKNVLVLP